MRLARCATHQHSHCDSDLVLRKDCVAPVGGPTRSGPSGDFQRPDSAVARAGLGLPWGLAALDRATSGGGGSDGRDGRDGRRMVAVARARPAEVAGPDVQSMKDSVCLAGDDSVVDLEQGIAEIAGNMEGLNKQASPVIGNYSEISKYFLRYTLSRHNPLFRARGGPALDTPTDACKEEVSEPLDRSSSTRQNMPPGFWPGRAGYSDVVLMGMGLHGDNIRWVVGS